jgi:nucleolar protein 12
MEADLDEDDEAEAEAEELVHESKKEKKVKVKSVAQKYTPAGESAADRDRRTVFVGNLPIECAKGKVRRWLG